MTTLVRQTYPVFLILILVTLQASPAIRSFLPSDPLFRQLQDDIRLYHAAVHRKKNPPPLALYPLILPEEMDIFSIAARCGLPYEAIATLNGFSSPSTVAKGSRLLVPNKPAVFANTNPQSDLDLLIASWRTEKEARYIMVQDTRLIVYPGERFHPVERAMFLGIFFRFPVDGGRISSGFGTRNDPFTGHPAFHNGIDIAAPVGTPVVAARSGQIAHIGTDRVLGLHVVIDHDNGYETLYGHLARTLIQLNQVVHSGMIIAEVGLTGMTTGPHLHFEVMQRGRRRDPLDLLPKEQR